MCAPPLSLKRNSEIFAEREEHQHNQIRLLPSKCECRWHALPGYDWLAGEGQPIIAGQIAENFLPGIRYKKLVKHTSCSSCSARRNTTFPPHFVFRNITQGVVRSCARARLGHSPLHTGREDGLSPHKQHPSCDCCCCCSSCCSKEKTPRQAKKSGEGGKSQVPLLRCIP